MISYKRSVSIIGYGNVGQHLTEHLHSSGINVSHILVKKDSSNPVLPNGCEANIIHSTEELPEDDLVLLCVPDDQIGKVVDTINPACMLAYTSGSVSLDSLPKRDKIGVFYPLQTFSKNKLIDLSNVPFLIESNNKEFRDELFSLATNLSTNVSIADSELREKIHVAAVWVNNFTNHMIHIAQNFANINAVDFELLKPLLNETIRKLDDISAYDAQTGPARRGDLQTIAKHRAQLTGIEKEIYELISKSIHESYLNNDKL